VNAKNEAGMHQRNFITTGDKRMRWKEFKKKFPEKVEGDGLFIERTIKSYLEGTCFKNLSNFINYMNDKKRKSKMESKDE